MILKPLVTFVFIFSSLTSLARAEDASSNNTAMVNSSQNTLPSPLLEATNNSIAVEQRAGWPVLNVMGHRFAQSLSKVFDISSLAHSLTGIGKGLAYRIIHGLEHLYRVPAPVATKVQLATTRLCSLDSAAPAKTREPSSEIAHFDDTKTFALSTSLKSQYEALVKSPSTLNKFGAPYFAIIAMCAMIYIYASWKPQVARCMRSCAQLYAVIACHAIQIYTGRRFEPPISKLLAGNPDDTSNQILSPATDQGGQLSLKRNVEKKEKDSVPNSAVNALDGDYSHEVKSSYDSTLPDIFTEMGLQLLSSGIISKGFEPVQASTQGCNDSQISVRDLFGLVSATIEGPDIGVKTESNTQLDYEQGNAITDHQLSEVSPEPELLSLDDLYDSYSDSVELSPQLSTPASTYEYSEDKLSFTLAPLVPEVGVKSPPNGLCELLVKTYMLGVVDVDPSEFYKTYLRDHQLQSPWLPQLGCRSASNQVHFIMQSSALASELTTTINWCLSSMQDVLESLNVLVSFEARFIKPEKHRAISIKDRIESFEGDALARIEAEIGIGLSELEMEVAKVEQMLSTTGTLSRHDRLFHYRSIEYVASCLRKCMESRGRINADIVDDALIILQEYQYTAESLRQQAQSNPRVLDDFLTDMRY